MDINEIIPLLHRSEDVHLEYKKEFPKSATDMGKEMAALANTDGGIILIGVDDGGQLVGVDNPDQVMQRLVGVAQQVCRPPICPDTGITSFGSDVSVVWTKVERNRDELCLVEDKCYVRYGSCSQPVKDGRELKWLLESQGLSVAVAIPCTPLKPPVTKGFVGRNDELSTLESLLSDSEVSVVLIEGIGGIGKTTLSAKFADVIAGNGWYSFWMHCLPETSFDGIAAELANHSRSRGDIHLTEILDDTQGSPLERARRYADALADLPYALFLDDFHLAVDVRIGQFIACMEERSRKMKTFLLVRKRPKMIGSLRPVGVREVRLSDGLDKESCGRLLTQCGISFGQEELSEIWRHTGKGHPKALQVLAVRARSMPIKALLSSLPVFKEELIEVWLGPLLDELSPDIRSALIELSVFNRPVSLSLVQGLLGSEDIAAILVDLVDRFLIEYVNDEQVQMHSLVRDFCYGILDDKEARHRFAADLYLQNACISTDQQTLDDRQLSLLFAAWWHLTRAKEDDRAAEVVRSWLRRPLMDKGRYDQVMLLLENTEISSQEQQEWFDLDKARIRSLWGSKEDAEILVYPLISSSSDRVSLEAVLVLATVFLDHGCHAEAVQLLESNAERFMKSARSTAKTRFLKRVVDAYLALGDPQSALEWSSKVLQSCETRGNRVGGAIALRQMGIASASQGAMDEACVLCQRSCEMLSEMDKVHETALSFLQLGNVEQMAKNPEAALLSYQTALGKFAVAGDHRRADECRKHIAALEQGLKSHASV